MKILRGLLALVAVAALPALATAQERGTVTGAVVDQTNQQPLAGVQIFIAGTERGTLTNSEGRYLIPNVPAGSYEVRATRLGYSQGTASVVVAAGETATANFTLNPSAVELGAVIVTATGERQSKREIGNSVATINVEDEVELAAVENVGQILQGRAAGVSVLAAGGTVGTGSRIRIRGSNSVSLSNDPLLIIDGVRADAGAGNSIGVGGQTTNRLSDMNPEDIESLEVLKGPAASALYGTAAANGVIVVTTKKGRSGDAQWRFYTEQGVNEDVTEYPANFGDDNFCIVAYQALGICESENLRSFNPLEDPETTPFKDGYNQKYGVNVAGGGEAATYFISGDVENSNGVYRFDANNLERVNLRANFTGQVREDLDVAVTSGFIASDLRLPQNDNNVLGLLSGGLLGWNDRDAGTNGYLYVDPEQSSAIQTFQDVQRVNGTINLNYRPLEWLSLVGTAGMDLLDRHDNETIPPERVFFSSLPEGERTSNRIRISNYTANLAANTDYQIRDGIQGNTSIGTQFTEEIFRGTYAYGAGLLAGTGSLAGTNKLFSVDEANTQVRTIGGFVQQRLNFADRFYLTGAVRADDNSAFGEDFDLVYYPSLSASWVVSEEAFFPQSDFLTTFRLRTAYGRSGRQPGTLDAIRYFSPVAVTVQNASVPGFTFGGTGNPNLEPEKSSEIELGFEAGMINDRLGLDVTYYNKTSEDLLVARRLAPSLGVSTTQFANLGEVNNQGLETRLDADLLRNDQVAWNAQVTASWNTNELVDLGIDPTTGEDISPIIFGLGGNTQRHTEGRPLGAYFQPTIEFDDADGNGLLSPSEVTVSDTAEYLGSPFPTREASFSTDVTLFDVVRLSGLLDYRGGYKQFNSTREFRCGAFFVCEDAYNPDTSLEDQANVIASAFYGTAAGYIEDADFVKLREIALTFMAPRDFASRFGANALSLTLSGRNLKTWTDYTGFDPEINFAGSGSAFSTAEFLTQPPLRTFTLRLDLTL